MEMVLLPIPPSERSSVQPPPRMEDRPGADPPPEGPRVGTLERVEEEAATALPYFVILYNDDFHSIDEVVLQVQKAAGVSMHEAFEITMEAHAKGRAVCYSGEIESCEKVAAVLREIRLTVEIDHYAGK